MAEYNHCAAHLPPVSIELMITSFSAEAAEAAAVSH